MGILQTVKDPVLKNVIEGLEAKMDPKMKAGYMQIVNAGMTLLFHGKTHHLVMQKLAEGKKSGNVVMAIVNNVPLLMAVLYKESKKKMFVPAITPAAITLMCMIFDLAEHAGLMRVTPDIVANATRVVVPKVLQRFGINRQQLAKGIDALKAQRKQGQQDIPDEYGAFQGMPS